MNYANILCNYFIGIYFKIFVVDVFTSYGSELYRYATTTNFALLLGDPQHTPVVRVAFQPFLSPKSGSLIESGKFIIIRLNFKNILPCNALVKKSANMSFVFL